MGESSKYFKPVDVKWKIYQNVSDVKQIPSQSNARERINTLTYKTPASPVLMPQFTSVKESPDLTFHKYLSRKFSPASIFIDSSYNILFINGNAGQKLSFGEGVFQNNLLKSVTPEIAATIRTGIRRLNAEEKDVVIKGVVYQKGKDNLKFDVTFHKPEDTDNFQDCYLIEFSEDKAVKEDDPLIIKNIAIDELSNQRMEDLENELKVVRTELQNAIEELETSNEELQSSNEELMASNEELQSTNEELQSVNEELYTVNSEMQEKNKELTNLSNDVTNLLDNTDIATLFLDTDLRIRKFTPALKDVFNLQESDLGRTLSSFTSNFDEDTRASIIEDSKLVLEKLITVEKQVKDKDHNFYLKRISPFITANKAINGVVITFDNINKLKETEKDLAQKDKEYHKLFEHLNEGFIHAKIITDKTGEPIDWEYIDVNPAYEKITGVKADEIIGRRISEFLPNLKDDPNNWIKSYGETALTGKDQTIEGYVEPLGKYFYVNTFCPRKGEFAGTISDFTDLKKNQEDLKRSKDELQRVQEITKVGSWYLDLDTNQVRWTKQLYDIYNSDSSLPPPPYTEHMKLFDEESWNRLSEAVEKTRTTGEPYDLELKMIKENGDFGWLLAHGEAVRNKEGDIIALRGAAQEITQQKLNEEELINAKKIAEAANIHKNYFLANMSHEIRTPMNGVLGFSELLKNDDLSKKDRLKYLEIIDNNSKQLLNLIDDIIDVSKIESNEIKMVYKECHIANLINNLEITYNQLKLVKQKSQITFKSYIPEEHNDLLIVTDPQRLQQVISNLLNNSLKFSDEGEISFGFNVENDYLKFFVKDEGIGIHKSKQVEIFERFKQINYENNAKYGGTGLGLAICKGIITILGGYIEVASELGKGTQFEFTIPLKLTQLKKESRQSETTNRVSFLKDRTILIAEDDSLIQLLFKVVLKNTGANILFANTGKMAVNTYKSNPDVDVILLDIRMPEMNGIDAMEQILKINPDAKIIMQTAYAMPDEREKCFNKGCVGFLSKPVIKEELFETLDKWID
ncbi:ATP-binding protein [Hyunsoonleella rubra]|uniref:histidine kinase n=1 Tax=Hyunsoonleella rubra TaxID=1737062 RepID=A0ABW5T6S2_9FLAO